MDSSLGMITPYSFVPHLYLYDYSDDMSLKQRCYNLLFSTFDALMRKFYYIPAMEKMAIEHFQNLTQPLPSISDLEKSNSIILVNTHSSINYPRPQMPGMVNVGGSHMKPLQPLPDEIRKFIEGAKHGVIFFSFGSLLRGSNMPQSKFEELLKVFGGLKQRVLWKFETNMTKTPSNVMMKSWLPQTDILAHPNIVLFISHGGLFGTIEASCFGVPILFMPFYGDQYRNAKMIESKGFGKSILFSEINQKSLKLVINEMIYNKNYRENAKNISKIFNDKFANPLDEAMYWIEHVAKFDGVKHLKSPAIKFPWYKYLMIDVLLTFLIVICVAFKVIRLINYTIFSFIKMEKIKNE